MRLASFRNGTTVAGMGGGGVFYVLEKIEWQPPEWLLWVVGLGSAALLLIAAILWGIAAWDWIKQRRSEPVPGLPQKSDPELDSLRSDVSVVANLLTNYEPFDQQEASVRDRYDRIKQSDHTAWIDEKLRRLRIDFLQYSGLVIEQRKNFDTAAQDAEYRAKIHSLARDIDDALKFAKPMNRPFPARQQEPELKRDIWLFDTINYLASGSWDTGKHLDSDMPKRDAAVQAICQAAADGELPVWGREEKNSGIHVLIEPKYWQNYRLDYWVWLKSDKLTWHTYSLEKSGYDPDRRYALMTSRHAITKLRARLANEKG